MEYSPALQRRGPKFQFQGRKAAIFGGRIPQKPHSQAFGAIANGSQDAVQFFDRNGIVAVKSAAGKNHPVHGKCFQTKLMEKIDRFQGMIDVPPGKRGVGDDVQSGRQWHWKFPGKFRRTNRRQSWRCGLPLGTIPA